MLVALYKGNHKKDGVAARLGYGAIRLGQIGEKYSHYTHCEAIFSGNRDGVRMGSASFRDGRKVRITEVKLNPVHWTILHVPFHDPSVVEAWFLDHLGEDYSLLGAMSSASLFIRFGLSVTGTTPQELGQWCSRSLGSALNLDGASDMSVSELASALWNIPGTYDCTEEFFR